MVVYILKYIGPFLRINTLNKKNIENQLFYLSKEDVKNLVLNSKCGITCNFQDLKIKNLSNKDINTLKNFSPLLCIYRKASCKLIHLSEYDECLNWNEEKFKKEISVCGNALMTLCLLELVDYYEKFKDIDPKKHIFKQLYINLCKKQLEFAASYFRNQDGVFVDKKDSSDPLIGEIEFTEKNNRFNFSDQALYMAAFYKCSTYDGKESNSYNNFSMDIFNMFTQCTEELYNLSIKNLTNVCLGLNLFYKYSNLDEAKLLLIDLSELLIDNYSNNIHIFEDDDKIITPCLIFINSYILYNNTNILKFKDICENIYENLLKLYIPELGIFIKSTDKKKVKISCDEVFLYLLTMILYSNIDKSNKNIDNIIIDIYKNQIINSGLILSWPETPNLDNVERYNNFSLKPDDLIDEQNFKMSSLPTPKDSEIAPVFIKHIVYNRKKETFSRSRTTFNSTKNLLIFFMILQFFKK